MKKVMMILMLLFVGGIVFAADEAPAKPDSAEKAEVKEEEAEQVYPGAEQAKEEISDKDIFEPERKPSTLPTDKGDGKKETEKRIKLERPFKLVGTGGTQESPVAYLLFKDPTERRAVSVGELIEFIEIKEIHRTYIRCLYGKELVRIDVAETSDDALIRLNGYGEKYTLVAILVAKKESFAHIIIGKKIGNKKMKRWRVEKGDRLYDAIVVRIETDKVILRMKDGLEIEIFPTAIED